MSDLEYWVAFNRIPNIGRARFALMEGYFGTLEKAWHASPAELRAAGLDTRSAEAITSRRSRITPQEEMERLERLGIQALTRHNTDYPPRLKEIYDLPPVIYVLGSLLPEDERSVAVVGTRKATAYGREVAAMLAGDLARNGITVISGLARGIDAVAHRAALEAGGRTIAVMGCGLDIVYPAEHAGLAREIAQHGAVVSEYPLGTRPEGRNFPRRNRIMSGMSLGTLVVEAGEHSGAGWTVYHALEQDREVFAVPGSVFSPASQGTNRLIRDGAKLVTSVHDILEELNLTAPPTSLRADMGQQLPLPRLRPEGDEETAIIRCLSHEPLHIDELGRRCGLTMAALNSALAVMELKGLVKEVGGMNFIRTREATASYEARV